MMRKMFVVALASAALAMPAAAQTQTLINEDFSAAGGTQVTSAPSGSLGCHGNVDIVANGTHSITCARTTASTSMAAPGPLAISSQLFQFYAGDVLFDSTSAGAGAPPMVWTRLRLSVLHRIAFHLVTESQSDGRCTTPQ